MVGGKIKKVKSTKGSKARSIIDIKTKHPDLGCTEIAKMVDCSPANVVQTLRRYEVEVEETEAYKRCRADIFADGQRKILLYLLNESMLKTMYPKDLTLLYNSLYNNERTERGQSGHGVAIQININGDPRTIEVEQS